MTEGIGFINYAWPELRLRAVAERYDDDGYAELSFFLKNDAGEKLLHTTRVNLLATPTMHSLSKRLKENSDDIPWVDVLTYITGKTLEIARRGEPVLRVGKKPETMKVEFQLSPILERNQPTTIYGPGGYAKSYLAVYIASLVQFDHRGIAGWLPTPGNVLYLDWESSSQDHARRAWAIKQGLGLNTEETFLYRFCHQPLTADFRNTQRLVTENDINLLIIDSQMAAAGYGPDPSQVSSQFYNALRSLRCTTLTLDHVSKAEWGKMADAHSLGPYGSVVKFNRSRSQFEIKKSQTAGEGFLELALIHRKHNEGKLLKPVGIRIDFHSNPDGELEKVAFKTCDISDNPELSKVQTLRDRLVFALEGGSRTVQELAEALDKPDGTVRTLLNRYRDTFVNLGKEWELRSYEPQRKRNA